MKRGARIFHRECWDLEGCYWRNTSERAQERVFRTGPRKMAMGTEWKKMFYEGGGGKRSDKILKGWKGVKKYFRKYQGNRGIGKIIISVLGKDILSRVVET